MDDLLTPESRARVPLCLVVALAAVGIGGPAPVVAPLAARPAVAQESAEQARERDRQRFRPHEIYVEGEIREVDVQGRRIRLRVHRDPDTPPGLPGGDELEFLGGPGTGSTVVDLGAASGIAYLEWHERDDPAYERRLSEIWLMLEPGQQIAVARHPAWKSTASETQMQVSSGGPPGPTGLPPGIAGPVTGQLRIIKIEGRIRVRVWAFEPEEEG